MIAAQRLVDGALSYARKGWQVFPLFEFEQGVCGCGQVTCQQAGRHPRTEFAGRPGVRHASTSPGEILWWWDQWPHSQIGLQTGRASGLTVLEIAPEEPAETAWQLLLDQAIQAGELSPRGLLTAEARSANGTRWLYFDSGDTKLLSRWNLREGIRLWSEGGFIPAPPASNAADGELEWLHTPEEVPPAALPETLRIAAQSAVPALLPRWNPDRETQFPDLHAAAERITAGYGGASGDHRLVVLDQLALDLASLEWFNTREQLTDNVLIQYLRMWNRRNLPSLPEVELWDATDEALRLARRNPHRAIHPEVTEYPPARRFQRSPAASPQVGCQNQLLPVP